MEKMTELKNSFYKSQSIFCFFEVAEVKNSW